MHTRLQDFRKSHFHPPDLEKESKNCTPCTMTVTRVEGVQKLLSLIPPCHPTLPFSAHVHTLTWIWSEECENSLVTYGLIHNETFALILGERMDLIGFRFFETFMEQKLLPNVTWPMVRPLTPVFTAPGAFKAVKFPIVHCWKGYWVIWDEAIPMFQYC